MGWQESKKTDGKNDTSRSTLAPGLVKLELRHSSASGSLNQGLFHPQSRNSDKVTGQQTWGVFHLLNAFHDPPAASSYTWPTDHALVTTPSRKAGDGTVKAQEERRWEEALERDEPMKREGLSPDVCRQGCGREGSQQGSESGGQAHPSKKGTHPQPGRRGTQARETNTEDATWPRGRGVRGEDSGWNWAVKSEPVVLTPRDPGWPLWAPLHLQEDGGPQRALEWKRQLCPPHVLNRLMTSYITP